jgi:hypothetical protein
MYDIRLAKSVTYTSQLVSRWAAQFIEKNIKNIEVLYMDTDSCEKNTIIESKKYGKLSIQDYYNNISGIEEIYKKNKFIKHISENDDILSFGNTPEFKKANYIMKHKTKKKIYKIKTNNNEVIITEDNSIIIKRNNKFIEVKPNKILKTDKLIEII